MLYLNEIGVRTGQGTYQEAKDECGDNNLPSDALPQGRQELIVLMDRYGYDRIWLDLQKKSFSATWITENPKGICFS